MTSLVAIVACGKGTKAQIVRLSATGEHLRKLTALGVLPGTKIEVLQLSPTFVLKVGYAEIALDYEIAQNIIVDR